MTLCLRKNVYACTVSGRGVFLDADAGRYFAGSKACNRPLRNMLQGREQSPDDAIALGDLITRGLIVETAGDIPISADLAPPCLDLHWDFRGKVALFELLQVCFAQSSANWMLRKRNFAQIVDDLKARKRDVDGIGWSQAENIVRNIAESFARAELLFPRADRCLARAIAFIAICNRHNFLPSLAFGVRIDPFAAHCWVEYEGRVLNDTLDEVRSFTPIMIV